MSIFAAVVHPGAKIKAHWQKRRDDGGHWPAVVSQMPRGQTASLAHPGELASCGGGNALRGSRGWPAQGSARQEEREKSNENEKRFLSLPSLHPPLAVLYA